MKTSLQELIEYQENQYRLWIELGSVNENEGVIMLAFINKSKSLIEKEKQDLIDAYNEGVDNTSWDSFEEAYDILISAEEYFKQTFKQ